MITLISFLFGCAIGSYIVGDSFKDYIGTSIIVTAFYFTLHITGQLK